jgi:hypothetical protein
VAGKSWLAYGALFGLLASCATTLSSSAAKVETLSQAEIDERCHLLGPTEGSSGLTGASSHTGFQNARNEALEAAAALGANYVVFDSNDDSYYWAFSETAHAKAYRCPPGYTPQKAGAAGCGKDTDCKGNRVCESSKCVQP